MKQTVRSWLDRTLMLHRYFRTAEYPMGPIRSWYEAAKMAMWWPARILDRYFT